MLTNIINFYSSLNPFYQTIIATTFTFGTTALGAACIYLKKEFSHKSMDIMLSFSGGIMLSVSFFSLIKPSLDMSVGKINPAWLPVVLGILAGGIFLKIIDSITPHIHLYFSKKETEGFKTKWKKSVLLVLALTIHNIPEGLIIGVGFGSLIALNSPVAFAGVLAIVFGIAIQNFPEGLVVSFPLRKMGLSKSKSFFYGAISGLAEPLGGIIGVFLVLQTQNLLPYTLAFAAGCMMYIVVEEVIPESQRSGNTDIATLSFLVGFVFMLILEVSLSSFIL